MNFPYDRCIPELRSRGMLPESPTAVYAGGSLVRGWGNATSDLDIYVIVDKPWESPTAGVQPVALEPSMVPVEVFHVDGRRWDIEYWLEDQIDQLLAKLVWSEDTKGSDAFSSLTFYDKDFLERLGHGLALEGKEWLDAKKSQLEQSAFRSLMAAWSLTTADNYTEDAVGQLEAGDVESAVLSAQAAFGFSVDALMASVGETGQNPKWRARRVREQELDVLPFDQYWAVVTMRDFGAGADEWVRSVLATCKRLCLAIEF